MPINHVRLNALLRAAAKEQKELTETDGTVPGLILVVSPAGTASWRLRYSLAGQRKKIVIGQYPAWGIAEAREEARRLRRSIDVGVDVALEKRRQKTEAKTAWTVEELGRYYLKLVAGDLAAHTLGQRARLFERYLLPNYGRVPVTAIKPSDVGDCVRASAAAGKTIPRMVLILWTQLYHVAVGQGMVPFNPCRDLRADAIVGKKTAPPKERTALKDAELRLLLRALPALPRPYELAIRLLLLTGVRVSQLSEARLDEFDFTSGVWRIPPERRKNRRYTQGPHELPLPPVALAWVKELANMADNRGFLFHQERRRHVQGRTPRSKGATFAAWLDRLHQEHGGAWRRITPHDLRATCKSLLSELRVDYEVRQKYLDHQSASSMDLIYDKSDLAQQKAEAARRLQAHLERLEAEIPQRTVVPFK